MNNVVKRFCGLTVVDVPTTTSTGIALHMLSCAFTPGATVFNGQTYDCSLPGLYRFYNGGTGSIHNRIAWGIGDIYERMSAISWNHMHGVGDENLSGQTLANAGMKHKWRLRCGFIADLVLWFKLATYIVEPARRIQLTTLEASNGVDDGHFAIEAYHDNKWKLWDFTNACYFTKNGVHLSAAEVIAEGVSTCTRVPFSGVEKTPSDVITLPADERFCFSSYRDMILRTEAQRDAWFARIYQSWAVG